MSLSGIAVSGLILRLKAKELCSDPVFKASLGWYQNWKKRHAISFRTKTTLAQRFPQDLEEKTIQFHRFVIAARQRHSYSLSRIFNMDETPMRFELPSSRTLEFSGSGTVPVKSCGAEKRSFTVTLAVAADGSKLPPAVIFKGVRTPRDLAVPDSVRVSFHKKGWMDEKGKLWLCFFLYFKVCYTQITDFRNCRCIFNLGILLLISGVKEWIRTCLPRNPHNERSLLVWDSFRAHLTGSVKADLQQRKFNVAVIPGGLTPVLQPLDKCLNKPFKDNIRRQYLSWMMTGPFEFTPAGKKKAPSRNLVLKWVKQSWAEIPAEMVRKSFKTCGISNALDGTEDDEVYADEMPELADDDMAMEDEFETDSEEEDE